MADTLVRNIDAHDPVITAIVAQHNALRTDLKARASLVHLDNNATVDASPTAADLPTVIVMANALKAEFNAHGAMADAHVAADATNVTTAAAATDQATSNTLLTELKADYNAHCAQAGVHINNDAGTVATADATTLGTSIALANALKAAYNAHIAKAASSTKITLTAM
jgi:hypothetical protein